LKFVWFDEILMYIIAFVFGAIIGSFLNVCIYRIPNGQSIVKPRSSCPKCSFPIPFYYNIPLLSYLILRGRCSNCNVRIPFRYFIIEFISGVLTVMALDKFGINVETIFYLLFIYMLIVIAFIDLDTSIIHNKILIVLLSIGIILNLVFNIIPWLEALLGFFICGGVMYLLALLGKAAFKKESMGMGDVKFSAVAGFFLGWKLVIPALYFGYVFALILYFILKLFKKQPINKYVPMGPFFVLSILMFLFYGDLFFEFYKRLFL